MGAKNQVIAGDYKGKYLTLMFGSVSLSTGFFSSIKIKLLLKNTK